MKQGSHRPEAYCPICGEDYIAKADSLNHSCSKYVLSAIDAANTRAMNSDEPESVDFPQPNKLERLADGFKMLGWDE